MLTFYLSLIDDYEEKSKFEQLYRLYRNQMLHIAYNILHNQADAEDAVHTAFIKIAANMNKIDSADCQNAKNYCLKTAKNIAINTATSKAKQNYSIDDVELYYDNLLDQICNEETYDTIKKVINRLDDIYKDVLTMYYVYDMNSTEISELFNRNKSTVKKQLVRGKKLLCDNLKKELNLSE